tara:strand:+ start:460 stop:714 length:255 start_codon:yes stop_codon:yes gene_type:complete
MDDLKNESQLIDENNQLLAEKEKYIQYIRTIDKKIQDNKYKIVEQCKIKNNGHKWISEREEGPYGERFTFCERCKISYYGDYFH